MIPILEELFGRIGSPTLVDYIACRKCYLQSQNDEYENPHLRGGCCDDYSRTKSVSDSKRAGIAPRPGTYFVPHSLVSHS